MHLVHVSLAFMEVAACWLLAAVFCYGFLVWIMEDLNPWRRVYPTVDEQIAQRTLVIHVPAEPIMLDEMIEGVR
jgi:hypothetical protein